MRTRVLWIVLLGIATAAWAGEPSKPSPEWSMNMTLIEACSCPMFCQCFFSDKTAAHHDHASGKETHFCKANIAFKVNRGYYGPTTLDGATFWTAGDVGETFADGFEWLVVTFDPSVSQAQRDGITAILSHVYPLPVKDMKIGKDAPVEWKANKDRAVATLDGGKAGEIVLKRFQGATDEPVVIRNMKYVGAARNDGFVLMPSEIEAYRLGERAFEFRSSNGFMITVDMSSKDVAKPTS